MKWNKFSEQKPIAHAVCLCKRLFYGEYEEYLIAYYDPSNPELPWASFGCYTDRYSGADLEFWIDVREIEKAVEA